MKYPCLLTKKINEISSAKYNPRKITDEAMGRLTKSLAEFGNIQPITWNARTGNVVGGHQRLKVYKAMGKTEVDVWAVDLDEQKEKAANIALNKLSGEFDMPMLKDILEEIDTGDLDMEITGFGMDEIALMMEDAHPEVTEDEVPEVPVDAITKPGDLWLLGEHRLLCGSSTKKEDVDRLMNGEQSSCCITDPPYSVNYDTYYQRKFNKEPREIDKAYTEGESKNDASDILKFMELVPANVMIWSYPIDRHFQTLAEAYKIYKWSFKKELVWVKDSFSFWMGAKYQQKHEPIMLATRDGKPIGGNIPSNETTVFEYPRPKSHELHPTAKPIELWSIFVKNHAEKGECIYEPFCGSGTTLIAAEQLGRKCYGMEISPNYCDVIVKRWENLTGKKATLAK
jgi:DNA modification methylase